MAKMMRKHGEDTPIHFDELLLNENPSLYEIFEADPAPVVEPAPSPKTKKAKSVFVEDDLNIAPSSGAI